MASEIVINATLPEIRVALLEDGEITDLTVEYEKNKSVVGNIYKGRIARVLPGMQAAFVDIGLERAAFLYVGDVFDHLGTGPGAARNNAGKSGKDEKKGKLPDEFNEVALIEEKALGDLEDGKKEEDSSSAGPKSRGRSHRGPKGRGRNPRLRRRLPSEVPNIQDVLREGQHVVVQVTKEQMGTKGARLTSHVSIPGRHVVLMPTVDHVGVSRKIASRDERKRLRDIIESLRPTGMGFIVRTSAAGQTNEQIVDEVNYLLNSWSKIKKSAGNQKAPSVLHEDLNMILKTIRDNTPEDIYRIVIDSPRVHTYVEEFVDQFAPHLKNRVVRYTGKDPIFDAYGIESEIARSLSKKVWLKSGGYLIVDQAEALTVIDVNTGKFIGKKGLEDTILQTNLETVKEVAYQLRLRNAGGIIIIDLIDMEKSVHREKVYRALEHELRRDKAKTNILKISELGLIQMTRKRTRDSLNHILCEPCPYCKGRGFVKNLRAICYDVFRELERTALLGGISGVTITTHPEVADNLFHEERDTLDRLEERFGLKASIKGDSSLHLEAFKVVGERISLKRSLQEANA